jgi:hypothetical protein
MRSIIVDEITQFVLVRPEVPALEARSRQEARCRLLAEAARERAAVAATGRSGRVVRSGRPGLAQAWRSRKFVLGAVAAAAAVAGVLAALPAIGTGHGSPAVRPHAAVRGTPATAAAVFLLAARAAAAAPRVTPNADQFVYTEQLVEGGVYIAGGQNGVHRVKVPPYTLRTWQSVDGKLGEASSQRNLSGGTWTAPGKPESECENSQRGPGQEVCFPGYLANLPDTVSGMLSYLLKSGGPNGPAAYEVLGGIANTSSISGLLVPNRSYALMYRAAATVRGIEVVPHASDVAGTSGIGVAACVPGLINKGSMPGFHGCSYRTELIFDARTYELIGVDHLAAPGKPALPGRPDSALLRIAVVNKIGQLP